MKQLRKNLQIIQNDEFGYARKLVEKTDHFSIADTIKDPLEL